MTPTLKIRPRPAIIKSLVGIGLIHLVYTESKYMLQRSIFDVEQALAKLNVTKQNLLITRSCVASEAYSWRELLLTQATIDAAIAEAGYR